MTTTFSRLLLAGASAAALAGCASVDLQSLPQPKYATRIEDVMPAPTPAYAPEPSQTAAPAQVAPAAPATQEPVPPTVRAAPSGRVTSESLPPPTSADAPYEDQPYEDAPPPPPPPPVRKPVEPRPAPSAAAPVKAAAPATSTAAAPSTLRYTVQSGDTLSGVGRRFAVPVRRLIELNNLSAEGAVRSGQKLQLPPEAKDRGTDPYASGPVTGVPGVRVAEAKPRTEPAPARTEPPAPRYDTKLPAPTRADTPATEPRPGAKPPVSKPATVEPARTRLPTSPNPTAPAPSAPVPPIVASAPAPDPAEVISAARGRFVWPVKGEIVSRYGSLGQGLRNDGVNIGAAAGTPVKAADAGEVVYAGDSVPGFGNLVLIKHADGWVTAYGHLGRIDVKMRQQVRRGDAIGQVGQSGGVDRPQLHFETRYAASPMEKARPLDPLPLLP